MLHILTSMHGIETVLMKLTMKQKQFKFQIARLEFRIFKNKLKWEEVNTLINEEVKNINSLNAAIIAAGEGNVMEKLLAWKVKAEYKLFKLNLRKNKIDIAKLILDQSKLEQLIQALIALEQDLAEIEKQKDKLKEHLVEEVKQIDKNEFKNNDFQIRSLKMQDKTKARILKMAS